MLCITVLYIVIHILKIAKDHSSPYGKLQVLNRDEWCLCCGGHGSGPLASEWRMASTYS